MIVAGAVNGVPAKLNAKEGSGIVLPFADNGVAGAQEFQKNGDIFLPPGSGPDRVAIIGGSTVGRDHFPFPVVDYASSNIFPIAAVPLSEAMLICWRIRKWRFHGSLHNTRNGGTASFDWIATVGDDLQRDIGLQASNIIREAELVVNGSYMDSTDALDTEDGGQYELLLTYSGEPIQFDSPHFRVALSVRTFGSTEINRVLDSRAAFAGGGGVATTVDAYLNPAGTHRTFTMYVNPSETGTITGSIAIEPYEYWPYATKAGLPVYDTTTGAQLRDPLS